MSRTEMIIVVSMASMLEEPTRGNEEPISIQHLTHVALILPH